MARAVWWQVLVTLLVACIAAVVGGRMSGLSAALGGLACVVPNALFALRLHIEIRRPGGAAVHTVLIGEVVKVAATFALLVLITQNVRGLDWLALIIGVIAALKSYLLMFLFIRR
jgi:ATP synthase protein I